MASAFSSARGQLIKAKERVIHLATALSGMPEASLTSTLERKRKQLLEAQSCYEVTFDKLNELLPNENKAIANDYIAIEHRVSELSDVIQK